MAQVAQIETPINAAQKVIGGDVLFKVERVNSRSCPLDNCPIMLRASLLANVEILPLARQGSYFFNRIGRLQSFATGKKRPRVCKNASANPCYDF